MTKRGSALLLLKANFGVAMGGRCPLPLSGRQINKKEKQKNENEDLTKK